MRRRKYKAASVSEGRFAFSGFDVYGLVVNPVGAAGVGAGVGWFGLAWLAGSSTLLGAKTAFTFSVAGKILTLCGLMVERRPIYEIEREIIARLQADRRLILAAPTGSGKCTQVPQMLLKH